MFAFDTTGVLYSAMRYIIIAAIVLLPGVNRAQEKKEYTDLRDALFTSFRFGETPGPRSVNWINGGDQYSFIGDESASGSIRTMM